MSQATGLTNINGMWRSLIATDIYDDENRRFANDLANSKKCF